MAWYRLGTVTVTNGSATDDALHGFGGDRFVAGGHWVIKCEGIQSEPVYLGQDENGR